MKLCHAAALVLVGWYLMMPPLNRNLPDGVDTDAPLSRWVYLGSFDTASECNEFALRSASEYKAAGDKESEILMFLDRCIATDDPRLKKK